MRRRVVRSVFAILLLLLILGSSTLAPVKGIDRAHDFTRGLEFDYASWMVSALLHKNAYATLDVPRYVSDEKQKEAVLAYLDLVRESQRVENHIREIYSSPDVIDPRITAANWLDEQAELDVQLERGGRLAEAVIQYQISVVLEEVGLSLGGQPIPPPLYQITPLPLALIISPRDTIRQDADISLLPDLSLVQITELEQQVEKNMNVSALVVPVGGVGVYPTMVTQTTDLPWLLETVAHEWIHNYLTLRPLGFLYYLSPEMRTMNETVASIAGKEIGSMVLARFYPEYYAAQQAQTSQPEQTPSAPPAFDFRKEMHETRVTVDRLLSEGKVTDAENYMSARRVEFLEHGYRIRRLNQAYFAFYGAYADTPGGAAGNDPVGALVRALRARTNTLKGFLNRIAWMTSYNQLVRYMEPIPNRP